MWSSARDKAEKRKQLCRSAPVSSLCTDQQRKRKRERERGRKDEIKVREEGSGRVEEESGKHVEEDVQA